ncbi:hypothetical protein F4827_001697 [Paraburkholderia bannensis]|uniref:Uncharacterized protein n=1 Tax=Paraburkholderia bannensis TaxID=765414 RepID=A0A7W9WRU2_9BURK|nr:MULTISPECIES: hypothetical protein [Paraburkholderia]MBB3256852.1 hypothetical protein [Paraburkholderia sp. WP4_3_2]MBB6101849.1 hypothetical protein [Paraburkholderia bannensis]
MKRILAAIALLLVSLTTSAQFTPGTILGAAQLNNQFSLYVPIAGGTLTGPLTVPSLVVSGSATFTSPNLGTPSSAVLTNATGLPLTTGVTGVLPAANLPIGTSGAALPLLNTGVTWSSNQAVSNAYPGLSTSTDYFRSVIGGFPISDQYAGVGYQINGVVGAVTSPSGSVTGAHIFDSGVSGYAQTSNTLRDAVGLYGESGILASGASAYGLNTEAINCENHSTTNCGYGKGLNVGQLWSIEADVSLYKVGTAQPTGNVAGVASIVYAETQPTGQFNAFYVGQNKNITGTQPWKTGLTVDDGSASTAAIIVGASAAYTSSALASMPMYFMTYNASGTQMPVSVYADTSQNLHASANNIIVDGNANPALGVHNTTTGTTWYLISNGSGNLQFYNGAASPLSVAAASVSANVPLQLSPTTFSALPTCASGTRGMHAFITDASAAITTWHQQVTAGGGSNTAYIACNGSGWYAFDY